MKTKPILGAAFFTLLASLFFTNTFAQSNWNINGNTGINSAVNYLGTADANDLPFRTFGAERGRLFSNGEWRFGVGANYASINNGVLSFNGTGVYQVAGNKYAFQYSGNPNYGLFFNSSSVQYEFRNGSATPVFFVQANTGAGTFLSTLKVGAYTLPATDGLNNQVLKTDGAGNLTWKNDNNSTYTAGTGLSLSGTTFTNAAPDLVVGLTGTNGISTSGTYPNFTISGNGLWKTTGNAGTIAGTNFIGTTDAVDFVTKTGNVERMRVTSSGNVGIGITTPGAKLHLSNGVDVSLTGGGTIIMGPTTGVNLAMDNNEIQARNNSAASTLYLNNGGGNVNVGGSVLITGNVDATGTVGFGSVETFSDGGSNTIASNSSIVPTTDNLRGLGTSSLRWTSLWATDGTINTSDARDKTNIRDLNYGLKEIMQLRSVKFNWKNAANKEDKIGLIAQDLKKVLPEVVRDYEYTTDENTGATMKVATDRMGVMYADIIPVLIRAIQEQQKEIDDLKSNQGNTTAASSAEALSEVSVTNVKAGSNSLEQNIPNPLRNNTSIRYQLAETVANAILVITDATGKSINKINLKAGSGVVQIDASSLSAGTYTYTLFADGRMIASKKMVVVK